jgi:hypothetical protein
MILECISIARHANVATLCLRQSVWILPLSTDVDDKDGNQSVKEGCRRVTAPQSKHRFMVMGKGSGARS